MTGIMGYLFLGAGVGMVVIGLFSLARTRRFLSLAHPAPAEVVGNHSRRHRHKLTYYPVLRYRTHADTQHEVTASVGSNPPRYREGDRLTVLYNPANPEEVRIRSFLHLWLLPLLFGGMGGIFMLVGAVVWMASPWRR
jgi:hypothetical protein